MKPGIALAMDPARTGHVLPPDLLARLATLGRIVDPVPLERFDDARARSVLAATEILVTGWGCPTIDAAVLGLAPHLRLVAHAAGTVKHFIGEEVYAAGIRVTHAAEANAVPVAEFTLAAILFAAKQVFRFHRLYREDRHRGRIDALKGEPIGNYRKTVGIVGASRIGRRVVALLQPFGFTVLLYDPHVDAAEAAVLGVEAVPLGQLMARSDVVSLHAPALPATRHMISGPMLARLSDGATLINTARGIIVDEEALIAELRTGRISAIIDVTEPEVPPPTSPLYDLPNLFLTPHIAGAVGTERTRLGEMAVDEIARFCAGEPLLYEVHPTLLERLA